MPRETIDITTFSKGIITGADASDLPKEAAIWALDVDPDTYPGELATRPQDTALPITSGGLYMKHGAKFLHRSDGTRDLLYYQDTGSAGAILHHDNFPTDTSDASAVTLDDGKIVAIEPHNDCAYVGWGATTNEPAKWVGYIPYGQFGDAAPTAIQGINAACVKPETFPMMYKIVADDAGTTFFGIEWKGKYVYKFTTSGVTAISNELTSTQGLCYYNSTHILVMDYTERPGTILKILMSDLSIVSRTTFTLNNDNNPGLDPEGVGGYIVGFEPSDLIRSNSKVWIGWYTEDQLDSDMAVGEVREMNNIWIWQTTTSNVDTGGTYTPSTFAISLRAAETGGSYLQGAFVSTGTLPTDLIEMTKTPFFMVPNTATAEVGYLFSVKQPVWYDAGSYNSWTPYGMVMFIVEAFTTGTVGRINGMTDPSGASYTNLWTTCDLAIGNATPWQMCVNHDGASGYGDYLSGSLKNLYLMTKYTYSNYGYENSTGINTWIFDSDRSGTGDNTGMQWTSTTYPTFTTPTGGYVDAKTNVDNIIEGGIANYFWDNGVSRNYMLISSADAGSYNWMPRIIRRQFEDSSGPYGSVTRYKRTPVRIQLTSTFLIGGSFSNTKKYFYKASFRYDGLQESPLMETPDPPWINAPTSENAIKVAVTIDENAFTTTLSPRVNAIVIYRAEAAAGAFAPDSYYREVGSIDMTKSWGNVTDSWGVAYQNSYTDNGSYGAAFESNAGFPESLTDSNVNYELSTQYGGYHYVGRCYSSYWDDAKRAIFRSRPNAFSTFNVLTDYVILPTIPTALAAFNGYVYAFDQNHVYRINAQNLALEDTIEGYGAINQDSILVTDTGVWFANANNIYLFNGSQMQRMGDPIAKLYGHDHITTDTSHTALMNGGYNIAILDFGIRSMIACMYTKASTLPCFFMYHLKSGTWHHWTIDSPTSGQVWDNAIAKDARLSNTKGGFTDINGQLYVAAGTSGGSTGIAAIAGSTFDTGGSVRYKALSWYTAEFPLDDHTQRKKFYGSTVVKSGGTVTTTYSVDGATYGSLSAKSFFTRLGILLTTTTTFTRIKALGMIFRRMIGKR